jgi:hypothetical protein
LKRIDCRVSSESQCKDRCVWKGDAEKCLLHVPTNFDVGSNQVPAARLLVRKLIEELARFPEKRKQLLNQDVGQYVKIFAPFRSGDQYIVSEDLPAWSEMMRMDWLKKEDYKYIEEYSAIQPLPEVAAVGEVAPEVAPEVAAEVEEEVEEEAEVAPVRESTEPIPSSEISFITSVFGNQFFFIPMKSVTDIINMFGVSNDELEAIGQPIGEEITDFDIAEYIAQNIKYSLYQLIYLPGNPIAPKPLIIKLQSPEHSVSDVVIIIVLPDGRIGLLSSSPEPTPIPFNNLKANIKVLIKREKLTLPLEL